MTQLSYVVYVSKITLKALATPDTLCELVAASKVRNREAGISGFLCHGNQYFLQYAEGSHAEIEALCLQLEQDKRHCSMRILDKNTLENRRFTGWDMFAITFDSFVTYYANAYPFMPFVPYDWSQAQTTEFLTMFKDYYQHHGSAHNHSTNNHCLAYSRTGLYSDMTLAQHRWLTFNSVMWLMVVLIVGLMVYNIKLQS